MGRAAGAPGVLAILVALGLSACGSDHRRARPPDRIRAPTSSPAPVDLPGASPHRLLVGITEQDPAFVWASQARSRHAAPAAEPGRRQLDVVHPAVYRLFIDWAQIQPTPDTPPNWDGGRDGCLRGPPCLPWSGIREQLDAVRSRQQQGGLTVLVVLTDPPPWAAAAPLPGCRLSGARAGSNGVATAALPAYAALARGLLAVAAQETVSIGYLSAFNEPNVSRILTPQRSRCDPRSPSLAPARYASLVRALAPVLAATPGAPRLVLGETAAYGGPGPLRTGAGEFIGDLPRDVVCASDIWSQHLYISPAAVGARGAQASELHARGAWDAAGSVGFLTQLHSALVARGCLRPPRIWVTETGDGGPIAGNPRPADPATEQLDCQQMAGALIGWDALGYVDVAVQYSFREDAAYPVGLVDAGLTRAHATLALWQAWGQRRAGAPAPGPGVC